MAYEPASPELARLIIGALGQDGMVRRVANAGGKGSVFARVDIEREPSWFIKLVDSTRDAVLLEAEDVANWLAARGVRVLSAQSRIPFPDGRVMWIYPFHPGRPPKPDHGDLRAIGAELGRLHRALSEHPMVTDWRQRTWRRLDRLTQIRGALAGSSLQAGPSPERLRTLAEDVTISFDPRMHDFGAPSVMLHGDLNVFNLLIHEGTCTFLDFEDVHHSSLPAIFDLATVFERVVRVNRPAASQSDLLQALLDAYASTAGSAPAAAHVPAALKGLALRALCTLSTSDPAGKDVEEWQKFFFLMELAKAMQDGEHGD